MEIPISNSSMITLDGTYDTEVKVKQEEALDPSLIIVEKICNAEVEVKQQQKLRNYETCEMEQLELHIKTRIQGSYHSDAEQILNSVIKVEPEETLILNAVQHESASEKIVIPKRKPSKSALFQKIFTCELCNFKTLQKQRYNAHVKTHNSRQCFKCNECGYMTFSRQSLHCHKLAHPFKCEYCRYKASSEYYLELHMKTHAILFNKIFQCEHCPYATAYRHILIHHKTMHFCAVSHDNRSINITLEKESHVNLSINRKVEEESLNKTDMPFKCDECSYKTLRKDYLDQHKTIVHFKN